MPASYPNRTCTCGYTVFAERRTRTTQDVERWVLLDAGGLGSTPLGTDLGAGADETWGLVAATAETTVLAVVCVSCGRARSVKNLGGISVFSSYALNGGFFVIAADAEANCYAVRFTGPGGVFERPLLIAAEPAPPANLPTPTVIQDTPPAGAPRATALLRADLPSVDLSGEYGVELVDYCCGCSTVLVNVQLEAEPMVFTALDADLGGAPVEWLRGQNGTPPGGQPSSGSRLSIPFDKCAVVHEYDARFGQLPSPAGWSHTGSGSSADYALVVGGALRGATTSTLPSYWQRTTAVLANPGSAFSYAAICPQADPPYTAQGSGFDAQARYATEIGLPYSGVRYNFSERAWKATRLDAVSDSTPGNPNETSGWTHMAAYDGTREQVWVPDRAASSSSYFATVGSAGVLEVISSFGDRLGDGITVLIRNFVASYGGRFIRPMFAGFAQVTAPVLRLYLVADANAAPTKTARFRVRFATTLSDPYSLSGGTQEATVNFTASNAVYEVPFALSGLTAQSPFWFSIERVWDHGDDLLSATVHMIQATLRST